MLIKKLEINGCIPFDERMASIKDTRVIAQILTRINRLQNGNRGDCKLIAQGISELRIDMGAGWRVYFTEKNNELILLALVGSKKTRNSQLVRRNSDSVLRRMYRLPFGGLRYR